VLPWCVAPLLAARGIQDVAARTAFTQLMQYGLFPIVVSFAALCARALVRAWRSGELPGGTARDPRLLGLLVSVALSTQGWLLAMCIRGSTTMIPAHYHASIGAVTAAFMAVTYVLLPGLGLRVRSARFERTARIQPIVYGVGQMVFALGFALAGAHGMARKAYGAEQHARSAAETFGLVVMGLGGFVAIVGGVAFLVIVVSCRREPARAQTPALGAEQGRVAWSQALNASSIRSRT
jgi:hypothetical protein